MKHLRLARALVCAAVAVVSLHAAPQRSRIPRSIDNQRRVTLRGHLQPRAATGEDLGLLDSAETLPPLTLVLKPSDEQQAALDQLLKEQHDAASPNFHRWLQPEEFAERFGVAQTDIEKLKDWLGQQNLQVTGVARARNAISFTGNVGDLQKAFRTEFHRYNIKGRRRFANTAEPSIPLGFDVVVQSIQGLNNFHLQPHLKRRADLKPEYTSSSGNHYLSPEDLAVIYNVKPLHDAGFDGAGQKIAIAGQSNIDPADSRQFRSRFGLPAADPEMVLVPGFRDPGIVSGDRDEADLDIEWAGALAPKAKLIYVYSTDVMESVRYAIDQNLAPVLSVSYGLCEPLSARGDALTMQAWARQGNAQGITWINASGDSGGADCVYGSNVRGGGLAVDLPAAVPEVTGTGGTRFDEGSAQYWKSGNSISGGSVLSYIPEVVWNDSTPGDPASGGGGASTIFTKPLWQTGNGVPENGARNVPDVSLSSSSEHDGYLVYTKGAISVFGGTSAAAPALAGITAVLNQYLVSTGAQPVAGVGNMNQRLYALARSVPSAFHDITEGNNIVVVDCGTRSRNCVSGSHGYNAGPGYDQATGLGSVDAYVLVTNWRESASPSVTRSITVTITTSAANLNVGGSAELRAVVTSNDGGTPTGTVTFAAGNVTVGSAPLTGSAGAAVATLTVTSDRLQTGANVITAQYGGDASYPIASASTTIQLAAPAGATPVIQGFANGASFRQSYAPGSILAIFGNSLAPATASASSLPLPSRLSGVSVTIGGVTAPLYFVSVSQLNVQIPYELSSNQLATVVVNNNGKTASGSIRMSASAPGLFTDSTGAVVPSKTAARGQVLTFFFNGQGAVTPGIATGAAPAVSTPVNQLPRPQLSGFVTVGGTPCTVDFVGIPPGLVGVTQVNCRIGLSTAVGPQPLVVTVGNVSSPSAIVQIAP